MTEETAMALFVGGWLFLLAPFALLLWGWFVKEAIAFVREQRRIREYSRKD